MSANATFLVPCSVGGTGVLASSTPEEEGMLLESSRHGTIAWRQEVVENHTEKKCEFTTSPPPPPEPLYHGTDIGVSHVLRLEGF